MLSVGRRGVLILAIPLFLLLAGSAVLAVGVPSTPQPPPVSPLGIITHTVDLRPRLLDPRSGRVLWEGPPLTYLVRRPDGTLDLVPTGAETDAPFPPSLRRPFRPLNPVASPTPPRFIRVRHSRYNTCRNAVPGQVDVIPFEEYVARVLPAEMPSGWPPEALKAQAIAIRTYAWYQILKAGPDYDVSDWTDYQVMCDARYPHTDAVVAATRGQALFYDGAPILAMYSANNGHPTRGVDWIPYLNPVPDPVNLSAQRRGHGYGLSQEGAYLWARRGWNAYQILAHYYPNTNLVLPPDATAPAGSILPLELEDMTLGRGYPLTLLAAFPEPPRALTVTARTAEGDRTVVLTRTGSVGTWLGVWLPPRTFTSPHPITLTATAQDAQGRLWPLGEAHIWRDLRRPTITLTYPADTVNPRFPITVVAHTPGDVVPRIGVGDGWVWEEDAFTRHPEDAARPVTDTRALDGRALQLSPDALAYGPYTTALPAGRAYRAWFRLSTTATTETDPIVFLDVVANGGETLLGLRALRGIEFPAAGEYREYPVDFYLPNAPLVPRQPLTYTLEFRTHALGAPIRLDRVLVTSYPVPWERGWKWQLPRRDGRHSLIVKQTTASGRVSTDIPITVTLHVPHPAMTFTAPVPAGWITTPTRLRWPVTTAVAPPREGTFFGRFRRGDGEWSRWYAVPVHVTSDRGGVLEWDSQWWPDGKDIRMELWGMDAFSYEGDGIVGPFRVDQQPPTLKLHLSASPNAEGWYTVHLTVTVMARDAGIGVRALTSDVSSHTGIRMSYRSVRDEPTEVVTQAIPLRTDALYTLTITATDAFSRTVTRTRYIAVDTTPPQTQLFLPAEVRRPWIRLRWKGKDAFRVTSYDVEVQEGGTWVPWLEGTPRTEALYRGRAGRRVRFRARARDLAGWVGPWRVSPEVLLPRVEYVPWVTVHGR